MISFCAGGPLSSSVVAIWRDRVNKRFRGALHRVVGIDKPLHERHR